MTVPVADVRSNPADQIAHAVDILGRSKHRIAIFRAIYQGKRAVKTVNEIATTTGLDRKRVLTEGKQLADNEIIGQVSAAGMVAYQKVRFYTANKERVLRFVRDHSAFENFPTKTRPKATLPKEVTIKIARPRVQAKYITIEDIESFGRVEKVKVEPSDYTPMPERQFKGGIATILGEGGVFTDWGGEKNDLYTNKVRVLGRRRATAFGFKGPGTKGVLTPRKMGKNGDQIQRLFKTAAQVFLVQYWGQIDQSVVEQMEEFAKAKSAVEGSEVLFGTIDGDDSNMIISAYSRSFQSVPRTKRGSRKTKNRRRRSKK